MKKGWQQLWTVVQVITRKLKTDESAYLHCILRETGETGRFFFPGAAVRVLQRTGIYNDEGEGELIW